MSAFAIVLALLALVAGIFLWLAAAVSHSELKAKYPAYVEKVYRTRHQVLTRQGGPVRIFAVIATPSPNSREHLIFQMRALGIVCVASVVMSALLWALA